jgi:hypothetical protein
MIFITLSQISLRDETTAKAQSVIREASSQVRLDLTNDLSNESVICSTLSSFNNYHQLLSIFINLKIFKEMPKTS